MDTRGNIDLSGDNTIGYEPTETEAAAILAACENVVWPTLKLMKRPVNLPKDIKDADPKKIYEFRNMEGEIVMIQVRIDEPKKAYLPFTYWTDDTWRRMEPDTKLPLWGLEQLDESTNTVFLHEGAKAASHVAWMVAGKTKDARNALAECPWNEQLQGAVHLGWIGGAKNAYRTDWSPLRKSGVKRVYIVSDNDPDGRACVPDIARHLRCVTLHVQFTHDWPGAFDLADRWPPNMFSEMEGKRFYNGPSFRSCLNPATWATDQIPNKKGKPTSVLRESFKDMWAYVEEADVFVCTELPEIVRSEQILNKMLKPFSHVEETTKLIVKSHNLGRITKLCYRPDNRGRIVVNKEATAINLHVPSSVKPTKGNPKVFLEFMKYMFPNPEELKEMLRWVATIVAHPEVRMEYGVLLVSEMQGVGKTTLGNFVLAPLVGTHNTSFPTENDVSNSDFNGWLAHKRLAIVNEIYSGHSWKAYNKLKSYITDTDVNVNQKFQRSYTIENWCHIFACSNSMRALKMEDDDRRWFYPEVTELPWPREKFQELHKWLLSGGLQIIAQWASEQTDIVLQGTRAPMTVRKRDLIEGSRTEAQKEAYDLGQVMSDRKEPVALAMKDIETYIKTAVKGKVFDSDYDIRKSMKEGGAIPLKKRIVVNGRLQYVVVNKTLNELLSREPEDALTKITKAIKRSQDILPMGM
jgi:hypothetical protein